MWRSIGSVFSGSKNAGVIAEAAKTVGHPTIEQL